MCDAGIVLIDIIRHMDAYCSSYLFNSTHFSHMKGKANCVINTRRSYIKAFVVVKFADSKHQSAAVWNKLIPDELWYQAQTMRQLRRNFTGLGFYCLHYSHTRRKTKKLNLGNLQSWVDFCADLPLPTHCQELIEWFRDEPCGWVLCTYLQKLSIQRID